MLFSHKTHFDLMKYITLRLDSTNEVEQRYVSVWRSIALLH